MTKKAKSSKKKYTPQIYMLPFLNITYGFFPNRETLDEILDANGVPRHVINTEQSEYATTFTGQYITPDGKNIRYAFVYAERMLQDMDKPETRKLAFLAHEAYHVTMSMVNLMGENPASEEFIAYTLTDVVDSLYREYEAWKEANNG